MARKALSPANNAVKNAPSPAPDRPRGPLSVKLTPDEVRDEVKVNNASISELKNACDDAVKRYLARPELFKQIHLHTDVRLALGWLSVVVAAGTALYGYKIEFEKSKPVVTVGLTLYILLTLLQSFYAYFIEGSIVFVGKRKTFSKRIITERITLSSKTEPATPTVPPQYELSLTYVQSTSGGKSLLAKGKTHGLRTYTTLFDETGVMDQGKFEAWVGELVESVMESKSA